MVNQTLAAIVIVTLTALQGCSLTAVNTTHTDHHTAIPATDPHLEHYIAWIPQHEAQTATVAKALAHISLGKAREQAIAEVCNGTDTRIGKVNSSVGPFQTRAPASAGGYPAWYYRISQQPESHGCQGANSHRFYQVLQANLPVWIHIKSAENRLATAANQPQ
jgi:hypothetical protein